MSEISPEIVALLKCYNAIVVGVRDQVDDSEILAVGAAEEVARRTTELAATEVRARQDAWHREEAAQRFRVVAPACVANGWSLFPQARSGRRGPILVLQPGRSRKALAWKPLQERLPTPDELSWWDQSDTRGNRANVALIMGAISGGAMAVDIDISDPATSETVLRLADEYLGKTPFRRVGRAPRIILLYRSDPADPVRNGQHHLDAVGPGGTSDSQAIEILAERKPITAFGAHHKTGAHFRWIGVCRPDTHGPEHAPLITQGQVEAFLSAVDSNGIIIPNLRNAVAWGSGATFDPSLVTICDFVRPSLNQGMPGVTWNAQGLVKSGRESFVLGRAYTYVQKNPGMALTEAGRYTLTGYLIDECETTFAPGGERFKTSRELARGCRERIDSAAAKLSRGEMKVTGILRYEATGQMSVVPRVPHSVERAESDDLSWLPRKRMKLPDDVVFEPANPSLARQRALISDVERGEQAILVGTAVVDAFKGFYRMVRQDRKLGNKAPVRPVWLMRSPTGSGKSSTGVKVTTDDLIENGPIGGAMLFLQPSYENIHENVTRFHASRRGAMAVFRKNAEAVARDLPQGTRYLILEGKERAGCLRTEEQRILSKAGISSAGLCKATVQDAVGESEEKVCRHYDVCPVIAARAKIKEAEVIFAPTAFLTSANLPAGLSEAVAGVIVDERYWTEILQSKSFPTAILDTLRAPPRAYKRDKGETGDDLLAARERVASLAAAAIRKGKDPALGIVEGMQNSVNGDLIEALKIAEALVDGAVKVTGRAQDAGRKLHPDMTIEAIKALAERPIGAHLREEWRFWSLIAERLLALKMDAVERGLRGGRDRIGPNGEVLPGHARGERDMRIQSLEGGATIRISWRAEPNFSEHPVLLLDASADARLTEKVWGGREVQLTHIDARLNLRTILVADRTWHTSGFLLDNAGENQSARRRVAGVIAQAHHAISTASLLYGHGRIVVGAPKRVRAALMDSWSEPPNIDWMHYGAVRGLDFAREHLVALSFGRHEFPIAVIDGLVAAATYDDAEPEWPIDRWGDGYVHHEDGALETDHRGDPIPISVPQIRRTHPLRNGGSVTVIVSEYEGAWAKIIQRQFREEELAQFAGRLRPVYRIGEAPLWIAGSRVLPEGFVVDDVVSMGDLADPARLGQVADAIRRTSIADAGVIAAVASDSRLRKNAAAVLHELGLDGSDMRGRWSKGMKAVRAEVDGEVVERQIPAYVADGTIVDHTVAVYRAANREADTVEYLGRGAQPVGGHARSEEGDKVVAVVGTRAERADRELAMRDAVWDTLNRIAEDPDAVDSLAKLASTTAFDVQITLQANPIPASAEAAEVIATEETVAVPGGLSEPDEQEGEGA